MSSLFPNRLSGKFKGRKALITGGLGFLGSNLAHVLVRLGAEVTIVDSLLRDHGGNWYNIKAIQEDLKVSISDIRDGESLNRLVKGQDFIFNLAAQVFHLDSMAQPLTDLDINCRGQLILLEACRLNNPEASIVFASTRQVYGKPEYLPVDENHPVNCVDVNGVNKIAGEQYHILYHNVYGLRISMLRLTNTYGPRQLMRHNRANFSGWLIRQAIDGQPIEVFGDGLQLRDFSFVDDAVNAFLLCASSEKANGQVYNLGGDKPYTLVEFVTLLIDKCGRGSYRLVPFPEERKKIAIGSVYSNYDKIKEGLGWSPEVDLPSGLDRTIDYFERNREQYW